MGTKATPHGTICLATRHDTRGGTATNGPTLRLRPMCAPLFAAKKYCCDAPRDVPKRFPNRDGSGAAAPERDGESQPPEQLRMGAGAGER